MQSPRSFSTLNASQIISSPVPVVPTSPTLQNAIQSSKQPISTEDLCKKICLERFKYVLFISIAMQYVLLMIYSIFLNPSFLHPLKWLNEMISILVSPFSLVNVIYGICTLNLLLKEKVYYPTRIARFLKSFSHESLMIVLNFFIGIFTARLFVRYLPEDYRVLTIKDEGKVFINENYTCLLLAGVFLRFYYTYKQRGQDIFTFPIIHQSKLTQIKRDFIVTIKSSFMQSFMPTLHYFLFYIVCGSTFSFLMRKIFFLSASDGSLLNNFATILNIRLIIYTWILTSLIKSHMDLVKRVISIFATQPKQFPISSSNELTLAKALEVPKFQITEHLAAQDLYLLADREHDARRKEIYALSIPGGHPHNWKQLVQRVLCILDNFSSELKTNIDYVAKNRNMSNNNGMSNVNYTMNMFFEHKRIIRENNEVNGIRSFASSPTKYEPVEEKRSKLLMSIKQKLLSNRLIAYLFGEEESGKLNFLLSQNFQVIIWISHGIAAIVARSIKEDNYGVVQHDIKAILKAFIKLKATLEKVGGISTIAKDRNFIALKSAVRRSIYRIVTEFSHFFEDLLLDPEDVRALHGFVTFREL